MQKKTKIKRTPKPTVLSFVRTAHVYVCVCTYHSAQSCYTMQQRTVMIKLPIYSRDMRKIKILFGFAILKN